MSADRNLLLGLLAWQLRLISAEQLVTALQSWASQPSEPLADRLIEQHALSEQDLAPLEILVEQQLLEEAATPLHSAAESFDGAIPPLPTEAVAGHIRDVREVSSAGRYRPLREHARGGLGEVFVAVDEELGREVALKQIQARLADDHRCRGRFVREARITGLLEHPGVVPVYGLGTDSEGRLFYAMRFIRGESLEQALRRFHADASSGDPGEQTLRLRGLLTRFVNVCQTMAYAHARGVIHRDLKPGNIMLGEYGETLVVDWGLSRVLEENESAESDSDRPIQLPDDALTRTRLGSTLGTPAFMPPEQARGQLEQVRAGSDIFALGATLYMILTGKPPYTGPEALHLAQEGRIVPPRQLRSTVAPALQAICLKALAPRPEERYTDARQLGQEIERWLADEPVRAYREPIQTRLRRWARRHRTLVTSAALLVLLSTLGLGLGLWIVGREQARTKIALDQAEKNLTLARQAVDECFLVAQDDPQLRGPRMLKVKLLLLSKALPFYENFGAARPDDPKIARQIGQNLFRAGYIYHEMGRVEDALAVYSRAVQQAETLAASHPDEAGPRSDLAYTLNNLGELLQTRGQPDDAEAALRRALDLRRDLAAEFHEPRHQNSLANASAALAAHLRAVRRPEEALPLAEEAAALQRRHRAAPESLARTSNLLGAILADLQRPAEARVAYQQACFYLEKLVRSAPEVSVYQVDWASALANLGNTLETLNDPIAALKTLRQSRDLLAEVVAREPDLPEYRARLAQACNNLGESLRKRKEYDDALVTFEQANRERRALLRAHPRIPAYRAEHVRTLRNQVRVLQAMGRQEEVLPLLDESCEQRRILMTTHPHLLEHQDNLVRGLFEVAQLRLARKQPDLAEKNLREAIVVGEKLVEAAPTHVGYRGLLATTQGMLGDVLVRLNRPREGEASYTAAIRRLEEMARQGELPASERRHLAVAYRKLALLLDQQKRFREAVAAWDGVLNHAPPERRGGIRVERVVSLIQAGDVDAAGAEAEALSRDATLSPDNRYDLVQVLAGAALLARRDTAVPLPLREQRAEQRARRGVELLVQLQRLGYFPDRTLLEAPSLAVLRDRADFQQLLRQVPAPK